MNILKFYKVLPDRVQIAMVLCTQDRNHHTLPWPAQAERAMARRGFTRKKPRVLRYAQKEQVRT